MEQAQTNMKYLTKFSIPGALVILSAVGCGGGDEVIEAGGALPVPKVTFKADAPAGIPVQYGAVDSLPKLVAAKSVVVRSDPFSLLPSEAKFEKDQLAESVVQQAGGFAFIYEEPPVKDETPVMEPQPYRRIAGIVIADSVSALIDMADGKGFQIVHPGQQLGEWTVVSIDEEKAVLRRGGNKLPRQIEVRLESPDPTRGGGSGGGQGGNQGGNNQGGNRGGNRGGGPAQGGGGRGSQDI